MAYPKHSKFSKKRAVIFYQEQTDVFRVNSTSVIPPLDIRVQFSRHEVFSLTRNESWEFSSIPASPNIIRVIKSRRIRWAGHVATTGERRGSYRVLMGKPEGKIPLGRPNCRLDDNIKMDFMFC
jgi:hypothetical protein